MLTAVRISNLKAGLSTFVFMGTLMIFFILQYSLVVMVVTLWTAQQLHLKRLISKTCMPGLVELSYMRENMHDDTDLQYVVELL